MIELQNISKIYSIGLSNQVLALSNFYLKVEKGEFLCIMGHSGSGKSTLMNIIGCLTKPTSGKYLLEDMDISKLRDDELAKIRNKKIGFVFQSFNLLSRLTVLENVEVPLIYSKTSKYIRQKIGYQLLDSVGLSHRIKHLPNQLSGGETQRVAIARALSNNPQIILADEPTGNLDTNTGDEIMELLKSLNQQGKTIILVTHNKDNAQYAKKIIHLKDGKIC